MEELAVADVPEVEPRLPPAEAPAALREDGPLAPVDAWPDAVEPEPVPFPAPLALLRLETPDVPFEAFEPDLPADNDDPEELAPLDDAVVDLAPPDEVVVEAEVFPVADDELDERDPVKVERVDPAPAADAFDDVDKDEPVEEEEEEAREAADVALPVLDEALTTPELPASRS